MPKKIALLVRERQGEALRMAMGMGMTVLDDVIDVYFVDKKLEETKANRLKVQTMHDMDMKIYTTNKSCMEDNAMEYLAVENVVKKLIRYDHVLFY